MSKQVSDDIYEYTKERRIYLNNLKKLENNGVVLEIDTRRQITNKEKQIVWNDAPTHDSFDPSIFRIDILGVVAIKNILYSNHNKAKIFSVEYEHYISHSIGGPSTVGNICLLNAGANRSKGASAIYQLTFNETRGLIYRYAIHYEDLLNNLHNELHETCEKYDLLFELNGDTWSISKDYNGNYQKYDDEYYEEESEETEDSEETGLFPINMNDVTENEALIAIAGTLVIGKCIEYGVNKIIERERIKWYDKYYIPEILGICSIIAVAVFFGDNSDNKRYKR